MPHRWFAGTGAVPFAGALGEDAVRAILAGLPPMPLDRPGIRLHGVPDLAPFLVATGEVGRFATSVLGGDCSPVRAVLLDKSPVANWSLPWHQDRTIVVSRRVEVGGFGPWTIKHGLLHVEPPVDVLSRMVTLRIHLDPVPETNAPLLVAPGSHRLGRIPEKDIAAVVRRCGTLTCLASPGDIWLYATPILHASAAAAELMHRRVLQVDYAVGRLPGGLTWLGI